eukprot:6159716-Pyramimonas_sp.AAC.1
MTQHIKGNRAVYSGWREQHLGYEQLVTVHDILVHAELPCENANPRVRGERELAPAAMGVDSVADDPVESRRVGSREWEGGG